jgi:hypothetical protein
MVERISLPAKYSLPQKFESCVDGSGTHMRTYQKHATLSMMCPYLAFPCQFPAKRSGRELKFPAVLPESARKALIIQGSVLDIEKISRYFPVGREIRRCAPDTVRSGSRDRCNPSQDAINRFGVA